MVNSSVVNTKAVRDLLKKKKKRYIRGEIQGPHHHGSSLYQISTWFLSERDREVSKGNGNCVPSPISTLAFQKYQPLKYCSQG